MSSGVGTCNPFRIEFLVLVGSKLLLDVYQGSTLTVFARDPIGIPEIKFRDPTQMSPIPTIETENQQLPATF